ncbi:hypothetical protein [Pontivivens insulae]|uniref:Phosphomannomutase n=1 Tax=Pontivivens insulae TaxID=1639689 RepID=A0A2R8A8S4_9RHOB|nr:hypothetical protein [Pontivivens insulae]RED18725.1 hypothetical protein DFR53_0924 [Pontivivens insulae]SPF28623.1 hypothetical protein POI8812_00925 [Pontivivens insulae]
MFTIEHDFDATIITIVDDAQAAEDITISVFDDGARVEQLEARTGKVRAIALTTGQMRDLAAALDLPEGAYRLRRD